MQVIESIQDFRSEHEKRRRHRTAFVPTMGALHEGHRSLFQKARSIVGKDGTVAVSIFVNPTQFDRGSDLESYPRTLKEDLEKCEADGVDLVFLPSAEEVYAPDASILISESLLSVSLCGRSRPGHFNGVCTVVTKLYNIVQPEVMVFGEKDFQQLAIIRRLVRDLNIPVEIVGGQTVREESGLALSSRNRRLTPAQYADASELYSILIKIREGIEARVISPSDVEQRFREELSGLSSQTELDYIEVVDQESLRSVDETFKGKATIAIAVFFGDVRLIDHISIDL